MRRCYHTFARTTILAGVLIFAAACGSGREPAPTISGTEVPVRSQTESPAPPGLRSDETTLAVTALAEKLGVSEDAIRVVSVTTEEMPLSTLGCPPDKSAGTPQAGGLVLGKKVVLEYGGEQYTFHVHGLRAVLCDGPNAGSQSDLVALPEGSEVAVEAALQDLGAHLGLETEAIALAGIEKRMWNDASLGCPEPGKLYAQVLTPGFLIRLRAKGETYEYHASLNRAVRCAR